MRVAERLEAVRMQVRSACLESGRDPHEVSLISVSKLQPPARLEEAYEAGLRCFGENYVQALEMRVPAFAADIEWHLIGHLQSNKAKKAAGLVSMIHTVDSFHLGQALSEARRSAVPLPVLVQVNVDLEPSKYGVNSDAVAPLLEALRPLPGIQLRGLMCIPAPDAAPRRAFSALRSLRDRLATESGLALPELSMGMSDDFEDAIREGATMVRIGTGIFGPRVQ